MVIKKTEDQLNNVLTIRRKIEVLRNLVDCDKIPVEIALREGLNFKCEPKKLIPIYEIYELSDDIQLKIREILDRASDEVKQYLAEELKMLENKFSKIKVTNEN